MATTSVRRHRLTNDFALVRVSHHRRLRKTDRLGIGRVPEGRPIVAMIGAERLQIATELIKTAYHNIRKRGLPSMCLRLWTAACVGALIACAGGDQRTPNAATIEAQLDSTRARLDSTQQADRDRISDSIRRAGSTLRTLVLLRDTVQVAAPGGQSAGYAVASFFLATAGRCKVNGRIEVVTGGHKDLVLAVFRNDDFINWKNGKFPFPTDHALFATGPQTISTLDVAVPDSGTYDFVLSNRFSTFTPKTATGRVDVVCIGSPVPMQVRSS